MCGEPNCTIGFDLKWHNFLIYFFFIYQIKDYICEHIHVFVSFLPESRIQGHLNFEGSYQKGAQLGHMLLLNANRKPYMGV